MYFPQGTYLISDSLLWATYGNNDAVITAKVDASKGCITGFTIVNAGKRLLCSFQETAWRSESGPGAIPDGRRRIGRGVLHDTRRRWSVTGVQEA